MRHRVLVVGVLLAVGCAGGLPSPAPRPAAGVRPGVEVLATDSLHLVRGRRVGLVSNAAAVNRQGTGGVEVLRRAGVRLVALFSPQHGFRGTAAPGEAVESTVDSATGLQSRLVCGVVIGKDLPDFGGALVDFVLQVIQKVAQCQVRLADQAKIQAGCSGFKG